MPTTPTPTERAQERFRATLYALGITNPSEYDSLTVHDDEGYAEVRHTSGETVRAAYTPEVRARVAAAVQEVDQRYATTFTVKHLSADDIGRRVVITLRDGTSIDGPLSGLSVDADLIPVADFPGDEGSYIVGRTSLTIRVGTWAGPHIDPDTPVTVYPR